MKRQPDCSISKAQNLPGGWRFWLHPNLPSATGDTLRNELMLRLGGAGDTGVTPGRNARTFTASLVRAAACLPGSTLLHSGRNTVIRLKYPCAESNLDLVIKYFGPQSRFSDWRARRRGTKAWRAYAAALSLESHAIGVAPPLACAERWQGNRLLGSVLISTYLPGMRSFKDCLNYHFDRDPDCERLMTRLQSVANAIRQLHDCGFQHRDLGNQNILLGDPCPESAEAATRPDDSHAGSFHDPRVFFLDLNRGRLAGHLSLQQRGRDLSRLYLPSDLLRVFLEMYWGSEEPPPKALLRAQRRYRRAFALHTATRSWRHPWRERHSLARHQNDYPAEPDIWIWDRRSVQAIPALTSPDRRRYRRLHLRLLLTTAALLSRGRRLWRNWRCKRQEAFARPVPNPRAGIAIAIEAAPHTLETEIRLLNALNCSTVFLRFYHHDAPEAQRWTLDAFDRLVSAGFRVAGALVQDRRAVRDLDGWTRFCRQVLHHVRGRIQWIEYGHAINRVKWGIWTVAELSRFLRVADQLRQTAPDVRLVGPAVIDFEFDFVLAAAALMPRGFRWDALSLHLYVDRRGAPENRQGRFDALSKFALAAALSGTGVGGTSERVILSEFNWPLTGTGAWSPVGAPYVSPGPRKNDPSVDEATAARYLVRYLLLALCSGYIETCVFWRLAACGFGLIDDRTPGNWRKRPAFTALRHLLLRLEDMRFERALTPCRAPGVYALLFTRGNRPCLCIAWSHPSSLPFECPFDPVAAYDIKGNPFPAKRTLWLNGDPVYLTAEA